MGNNPIIEAWEDLDNGKYMPFDLAGYIILFCTKLSKQLRI